MPSEKILNQKQVIVEELTNTLKNSDAGVIVDYRGITVADDTKLRRELRAAGVQYNVVKNTLLRRATTNVGLEELNNVLEGTTALAVTTEDPFAAAKILCKYAEESKGKFVIKAGFIEGKALDAAGVTEMSKIPSKDALLATVLGTFNAPIAALARVINAIAEKGGETAEAAPAAE